MIKLEAHWLKPTHIIMGRDTFKQCAFECFGPLSGEVENHLSLDGPPLVWGLPVLFHPRRDHPPEVLTTGEKP